MPTEDVAVLEPQRKRKWKRRKPREGARYVKRRRRRDDPELPGEYTCWTHLAVMVSMKTENSTVPQVAAACKLSSKGTHKILMRLRRRGLVDRIKTPRRRGSYDLWHLTAAGERHLVAELKFRLFTRRVKHQIKTSQWRRIAIDIDTIRFKVLPPLRNLPGKWHRVYRTDELIQRRSPEYLVEALKWAWRAKNPAAYFVACCLGKVRESQAIRFHSFVEKSRWGQRNPHLTSYLVKRIRESNFVCPWEAGRKIIPHVESACRTQGNSRAAVEEGISYATNLEGSAAPRRTGAEV